MSTIHILYLGNNSIVDVTGLRDEATGAYVTDANVVMTLLTQTGAEVGGVQWPIQLVYVPETSGTYRATLPYTLDLTEGGRYVARIIANAGAGLRAEWDMPCVGRLRT
jgi:hypothetical protein